MDTLIKHVELIDRIDQLIRLKATGPPATLAARLGVSRTKIYRAIDVMKDLKAPIYYHHGIQSFVYDGIVKFRFGFEVGELDYSESKAIFGGGFLKKYTFYNSVPKIGTQPL
ncbi:HTH domain-containing protein [Aquimarina algicola]|uniref:HTH domain-containing protein n=1 Tax=Aquimarina algicola TaxID=2589995 RepID=A0A504JHS6_9FLAO|nr:HTH domain-containing protein [Aquimarina algicola]TPN87965.1 HTH domain-containing protein [Aquimarina algicola]